MPQADGFADGLCAGVDVQFGEDGGNVVVDGFGGDEEAGADLFVVQPFFQEFEDAEFAFGEQGGVSRVVLRLPRGMLRMPSDRISSFIFS